MDKTIKMGPFAFRLTVVRVILLLFALLGMATMLYRLIVGLGPATNLNDGWPFGLWKGLQLFPIVALSGGGFTMATLIYVLNIKEFKPLAKPAILMAWLGYMLVVVGLGMDIGLWYNFWTPLVWWGYTSVLFEVLVCVLLYNIVLLFEFLPVIAKRFNWKKAYKVSSAYVIPAVIAGIMLSSLHQSSLGALFLIVPHKLNPLWYTGILPWLFLVSAIASGPAMVTVISFLTARSYKMEFNQPMFAKLLKIVGGVLVVYVALVVGDLAARGVLGNVFAGTLASNMFIFELLLFIVPIFLIFTNSKGSTGGTVLAALLVVMALIVNRANVLFTGLYEAAPMGYTPAFSEFSITFGIIAIGCIAFLFIAENFEVFGKGEKNNPFEENIKNGTIPAELGTKKKTQFAGFKQETTKGGA